MSSFIRLRLHPTSWKSPQLLIALTLIKSLQRDIKTLKITLKAKLSTASHVLFRQTLHSYFGERCLYLPLDCSSFHNYFPRSVCFFSIYLKTQVDVTAVLAIPVVNLFATAGFPELLTLTVLEHRPCRCGTWWISSGPPGPRFVGISPCRLSARRSIHTDLRQPSRQY